jgi:hypothetical protein
MDFRASRFIAKCQAGIWNKFALGKSTFVAFFPAEYNGFVSHGKIVRRGCGTRHRATAEPGMRHFGCWIEDWTEFYSSTAAPC